jgi:hypothetical protein
VPVLVEFTTLRAGVPARESSNRDVILFVVAGGGGEDEMPYIAVTFKSWFVYPQVLIACVPVV